MRAALRQGPLLSAVGPARFINIKPGRVGGVTVAKQIHDFAQTKGIPCWIGGMLAYVSPILPTLYCVLPV